MCAKAILLSTAYLVGINLLPGYIVVIALFLAFLLVRNMEKYLFSGSLCQFLVIPSIGHITVKRGNDAVNEVLVCLVC